MPQQNINERVEDDNIHENKSENESENDSENENENERMKCPYCQKEFFRKQQMKRHIRKHTGERPYPCPWNGCTRLFSRQDNMKQHYLKHLTHEQIKEQQERRHQSKNDNWNSGHKNVKKNKIQEQTGSQLKEKEKEEKEKEKEIDQPQLKSQKRKLSYENEKDGLQRLSSSKIKKSCGKESGKVFIENLVDSEEEKIKNNTQWKSEENESQKVVFFSLPFWNEVSPSSRRSSLVEQDKKNSKENNNNNKFEEEKESFLKKKSSIEMKTVYSIPAIFQNRNEILGVSSEVNQNNNYIVHPNQKDNNYSYKTQTYLFEQLPSFSQLSSSSPFFSSPLFQKSKTLPPFSLLKARLKSSDQNLNINKNNSSLFEYDRTLIDNFKPFYTKFLSN